MGLLSYSHVEAKTHRLVLLTALAAVLYVGGGIGLAYVAGFDDVWRAAQNPNWPWLLASVGGVALAFVGYYFGYRGVGRIEEGPDDLSHADRLAVVAAGFGGFLALWPPQPLSFLMLPRLRRVLEDSRDADEPTNRERDMAERTEEPALRS